MKLLLGSHGETLEGHTTVDIQEGADIQADASDMHMIEDDSVDEIRAFHILEHFRGGNNYEPHLSNPLNPNTVFDALREWRRVLKPGGLLFITVPDFDKIVWMRQHHKFWALNGGANPPFPAYTDWLVSCGQHQCIFDKDIMRSVLEQADFANIVFTDGEPRVEINREHIEMSVTCQKPI